MAVEKILRAIGRRQLATALGVSESTVRNAESDGRMPAAWYAMVQQMSGLKHPPHDAFSFRAAGDTASDDEVA